MPDKALPPLPGSDNDSLNRSKTARDFWGENAIIRIDDTEPKKCDHYFVSIPSGVTCNRCHFGLLGFFEINNGKLFYQGDPIGL